MDLSVSQQNKRKFSEKLATYFMRDESELFAAEEAVFARYRDALAGARILDIGVGTGRTTGHLAPLSRRYVGVDYSESSIDHARTRFPDTDLRVMDARDLSAFDDDSFDAVLFPFNGIDYVDHGDRLRILGEMARVARPGALVYLASHNLDVCDPERSRRLPRFDFTLNPIKLPFRIYLHLTRLRNAAALRAHEVHTEDFAILNDDAYDHGYLTYYVTAEAMLRQLRAAGLKPEAVLDGEGDAMRPGAVNERDYMLHYVARA